VRQSLREEVVLSQLRQQKVVASITIAPEAIRRYYDEQTQHFYRRDQIDVAEVLVETEEEALAVRRQIEAGADIAAIAQERSKRRGARARGGVFPMEKTSDLVPHILAAQPGELVGPVQVHDGFSVFEIVRRQPGERMPFAQVRRQIGDILRRAAERERFQAYIETLRQQYADQIQVDQKQLAAALSDEFLTAF
jgi:peptidyl-prolyl cis-trans isomerase C